MCMATHSANHRAANTPQTAMSRGARIERLAKVISGNNWHRFYDTISGELLPPLATFIASLYAEASVIDGTRMSAGSHIEQDIVSFFSKADDQALIKSLSADALRKQRTGAISHEQYIESTHKKMTVLKGNLMLAKDARINHIYESVSLLCALSGMPLNNMVAQFSDDTKNGAGVYRPVPGVILIHELTRFAQVVHGFGRIECVAQSIDILNKYVTGRGLSLTRLTPLITKLKRIVDDNILLYIVKHINKKPFEEIVIEKFDDNVFEKYFANVYANITIAEHEYAHREQQEAIRSINANLFAYLPSSPLYYYNHKNKQMLERQGIHYFQHVEIIEKIMQFINHIFSDVVVNNLQTPLLLRASWHSKEANHNLAQIITDIKDLKKELITIDQDIPTIFTNEKMFTEILQNFNFVDKIREKTIIEKLTRIDSHFSEMIDIFQGIARYTIKQLRDIQKDRNAAVKKLIENWPEISKAYPNMKHHIVRAVTAFEHCAALIDAVRSHADQNTHEPATRDSK